MRGLRRRIQIFSSCKQLHLSGYFNIYHTSHAYFLWRVSSSVILLLMSTLNTANGLHYFFPEKVRSQPKLGTKCTDFILAMKFMMSGLRIVSFSVHILGNHSFTHHFMLIKSWSSYQINNTSRKLQIQSTIILSQSK